MTVDHSEPLLRSRKPQDHGHSMADMAKEAVHEVTDIAVAAEQEVERALTILWGDLPEWLQDGNDHIYSGYRQVSGSIDKCIRSLTYLHNESVNIWSHIIGSIIFFSIPIYVFNTEIPPRYAIATRTDIVVCTLYFLGVATCFFLSATFHTIMNHSPEYHQFGLQLDFLGILILMFGATIPMVYYGFICDPTLQRVYWSLLFGLALGCAVATFQPKFRNPRLNWVRASFFSGFAAASVVPIIHSVWIYGWRTQYERMGLLWVGFTLVFNAIGATSYAIRFPEKWYPRRFDIFGGSHQILHIAVIIAGLAFTLGVLQSFDFLHQYGDTCVIH